MQALKTFALKIGRTALKETRKNTLQYRGTNCSTKTLALVL